MRPPTKRLLYENLAIISEGVEMVYVSGTFGCNGQGAGGTIAFALSFFPI